MKAFKSTLLLTCLRLKKYVKTIFKNVYGLIIVSLSKAIFYFTVCKPDFSLGKRLRNRKQRKYFTLDRVCVNQSSLCV